ncbi:MAG TPA: hypothetical protein VJA16_05315 [Thermoanaerobaculia bacterium]
MRALTSIAIAAATAWLGAAGPLAAAATKPADLVPCAYSRGEASEAMSETFERTDPADMTIPVGRDVGCLYTLKGSDLVFGVRQTWDSTRPTAAPVPKGYRKLPGDPNGAVYTSDAADGSSGELVYVVGKVQVTVFWHGANLTDADGLQRLQHLRRLP